MLRFRILSLFSLLTFSVLAQKPAESYTAIFNLLKEQRAEEAEPLLKKYILTKNPHASAFIELGNLYYQKAVENFILDDDNTVVSFLDSAVYAYQKALSLLSESSFTGFEHFYQYRTTNKKREIKFTQVQKELEEKSGRSTVSLINCIGSRIALPL